MTADAKGPPERIWHAPEAAQMYARAVLPSDVEYIRADAAREMCARELDEESRRIIGPPADTEDAAHRSEKSFGYWAAARHLRSTTGERT